MRCYQPTYVEKMFQSGQQSSLTLNFHIHRTVITAKDHASVQLNIAEVDDEGKMIPGKNVAYAFSGFVRREGEADDSLNRLATRDGRKPTLSCDV